MNQDAYAVIRKAIDDGNDIIFKIVKINDKYAELKGGEPG